MDAREARKLLPEGWSLVEAVKLATRVAGAGVKDSLTVETAVDRFLRSQLGEVASSTWTFYDENLGALARSHGDVLLRALDRHWLTVYFAALPAGKPQRWRAVRRLLKWSVAEGILPTYPAEGFGVKAKRPERIAVFSREVTTQLMQEGGVHTAALALMAFAGVRPYEVSARWKPPFLWGQIDWKRRAIRIEADQAKTGVARVLDRDLPPMLWFWLEVGRRRMRSAGMGTTAASAVSPATGGTVTRRAKRIVGQWSPDVLRHTFASCHLSCFGDLTRLSLLLGHEGDTRMIHRHYAARVEEWEARRLFFCPIVSRG